VKTIIVDIDSTMSNHWVRIRRNTLPYWPGSTISNKAWSREEVLTDTLLPGCQEVLFTLSSQDFHICYLTARNWPDAREITLEQLAKWEVPNPKNVMFTDTLAGKVDVLSKEMCHYLVDDFMTGQEHSIGTFHAGVAKAIQAKGIRVIVFRNDWWDVYDQIRIYENNAPSTPYN